MSIMAKIRDLLGLERTRQEQQEQREQLDRQLEDTFPSSDPPGITHPDHGTTGPELARKEDAPPIRTTRT